MLTEHCEDLTKLLLKALFSVKSKKKSPFRGLTIVFHSSEQMEFVCSDL
jgi:hypothetical protein